MNSTQGDRILAFVDESGDPSTKSTSSRHFVMSAVLVRQSRLDEATDWLAGTRKLLGRQPEHTLHWVNLKRPEQRLLAAQRLGEQPWGRFISVVACKDHLPRADHLNEGSAYLYTMRFLLERISWFSQMYHTEASITIAHKQRLKKSAVVHYENRLRALPRDECSIDWRYLDPRGAQIDQPKRCEHLQIADFVASGTGCAFEARGGHPPCQDYVRAMLPRVYRGTRGRGEIRRYGLKMHPWSPTTEAAYPWVAAL